MNLQHELGLQVPFEDIRHEAVLNVVRTATLLSAKASQLFRKYDLTEAQFNVLFALKFSSGDTTQAELGKRLVVTRASVTSVLDKLESKGLVRRIDVPQNRRIHHVELTAKGTKLFDRVEPIYRGEVHSVLDDFSKDECASLIDYMEKIRSRVQDLRSPSTK